MNRCCRILSLAGIFLIAAPGVLPASAGDHNEGGLPALMERNRQHFRHVVETAYFESVEKQLAAIDYQRIRQEAEAITAIALQARSEHSRGKRFDELARDLEKHAEKATRAAAGEDLPEINVEVGEMAEYCAECHNAFRWNRPGM